MNAEVKLKLDFRKKIPISDQVQTEMRRLIQEGFLHPGDQLPTVRVLAAQLKVNFNTIARAYRLLDQEGLISTQQGRGTYVAELESDDENPERTQTERTKEEWAEQLISNLIENATRFDISSQLLYQTFLQHLKKQPAKKPEQDKPQPKRRMIRKSQRKFFYTQADNRGWVKSKAGSGLKKSRKVRIIKHPVHDSVSRETES